MYNVQVSTLPFHRGDHAAQASAFRRCNWEPAAGAGTRNWTQTWDLRAWQKHNQQEQ